MIIHNRLYLPITSIPQNESIQVAQVFYQQLQLQSPQNMEEYKDLITKTGELSSQKGKNLFMPIRVFTTGKTHGLELPVLFALYLTVSELMIT